MISLQNGQAVIAIISDVFKKLKKLNIEKVTIRSDNAGKYFYGLEQNV